MEKIGRAITAKDLGESLYFCDLCENQVKWTDLRALLGREMVAH
jgi:hypothetical protein